MTPAFLLTLLFVFVLPACADDAPAPPGYAGEEMCAACHTEQAESYAKTAHGALSDASRPEAERACEACHGPGQAHADEGGGKGVGGLTAFAPSEPAAARAAVCLRCHGGATALHDFPASEHAKAKVACTDCHEVHRAQAAPLLEQAPPGLCYRCHPDVKAKFALPEHHKVPEGVMACVDCHQPHGSRNRAMMKAHDDRACFACHGDIEGPFVFEHVGLVSEGCQACHEPHGSTGRHLLKRRQVAQLCLECHTVTPSNHQQPSFRDCTRCHTAIHGSNTNARFLEP